MSFRNEGRLQSGGGRIDCHYLTTLRKLHKPVGMCVVASANGIRVS